MQKVFIVIPAYNEERRIGDTLSIYSEYFESLRKAGKIEYKILVVINGTSDSTPEIVKGFSHKNSRIDFLNLKKGGKGYAVTEGFKEALKQDFNLIGFVDADCSTSPMEYYRLISSLKNEDGVIASRYIKGAIIKPKPTFQRRIVSRVFNSLIRSVMFLPYKDTQCGAKIFKRDVLERILPGLGMSKWAFDVELLFKIRKAGFSINEVPTVWSDKEYSKINFMKAGPWMALSIIRLRLINSPFKFLVRIYDKFISFVPKLN